MSALMPASRHTASHPPFAGSFRQGLGKATLALLLLASACTPVGGVRTGPSADTFQCATRAIAMGNAGVNLPGEVQALRQREALPDSIPDAVLEARVRYAHSGDLSEFNAYLPRRARLCAAGNLEALSRYDAAVARVKDQVTWIYLDWTGLAVQRPAIDPATRDFVAARLVDFYLESPLLEAVLARGLTIAVNAGWPLDSSDSDLPVNSFYITGSRRIDYHNTRIWLSVARPDDDISTVEHEFAHAADDLDTPSMQTLDGLWPGLSPQERATFLAEWERLRALYQLEAQAHRFSEEMSPTTGVQYYAFSDAKEFLAVMVETFRERPQAVRQLSAGIYGILERMVPPASH